MNQFLRLASVLLVVGLAASATTAHAQTYYFWQLEDPSSGSYHTTTNWDPADIPDAAGEVAVINKDGQVQITQDVGGLMGGVDEMWVGDGSTTSPTPGEGHVLQTAGNVYVSERFYVGHAGAPGTSTYTMENGTLTLLNYDTTNVWGFRLGETCTGSMSLTGSDSLAPTTVTAYDNALIGYGASGNGTLEMSGYSAATFDSGLWVGYGGASGAPANGGVNLSGHANLTVNNGGAISCYPYSHGELHLSENAQFTSTHWWYNVGDSGSGEATVTGDAILQTANFRVGIYPGSQGTLTISSTTGHTATWNAGWFVVGWYGGNGEFILRDGGVVNATDWVSVGQESDYWATSTGSNGTVTMEGGQVNLVAGMGISVGYVHNGSANWNQSGGVLASLSHMEIGRYGGVGTARFTGDAQATLPSIRVGVNWANDASDLGVGEVFVDDAAQVTVTGVGTYGNSYANTITLAHGGGDGTWTQNGGTTTCANAGVVTEYDYWDTSEWSPGVGVLNLNGGVFACPGIMVRANSNVVNGTSGTVNLNGGTLQATAASTDFFTIDDPGATPTSTLTLHVQAGGAVFDTGAFNVTITDPLLEDAGSTGGGLTKLGAGTLALTSTGHTYTGDTRIDGGVLSTADNAMLDDLASLWIDDDAQYNMSFSGTDTIGGLYFDGVAQTLEGTWGALGSGAAHESAYFTGTGFVLLDIYSPVLIPGDTDGNQIVDDTDAAVVASHWGQQVTPGDYESGDFNNDGRVNAADAAIQVANRGSHVSGGESTAVPEPSMLVLCGAALAALSLRRRLARAEMTTAKA